MYTKILSKIKLWSEYHRQMRRARKIIKAHETIEKAKQDESERALLNIIHDYREEMKANDKRN